MCVIPKVWNSILIFKVHYSFRMSREYLDYTGYLGVDIHTAIFFSWKVSLNVFTVTRKELVVRYILKKLKRNWQYHASRIQVLRVFFYSVLDIKRNRIYFYNSSIDISSWSRKDFFLGKDSPDKLSFYKRYVSISKITLPAHIDQVVFMKIISLIV